MCVCGGGVGVCACGASVCAACVAVCVRGMCVHVIGRPISAVRARAFTECCMHSVKNSFLIIFICSLFLNKK